MSDEATDEGTCVATVGCKRHATYGYICTAHFHRMADILREIEDQAAILSAMPSMAQRRGNRGASLASHRSPARLDAIVHSDPRRGTGIPLTGEPDPVGFDDTASILDVLHAWARIVREERKLTPPETITVSGERDLLTRQLDFVAKQPWVDEAYDDLWNLLGQLKSANGTSEAKPAGRCYLPAEDGPCGGNIRRTTGVGSPWRPLEDRCVRVEVETADGHAYCERCGQTWDGPQLAMLNYELERAKRPKGADGMPLWTAQEIATEHGVKVGTIAVWAHRRGIVSIGGYYDAQQFRDKATA